MKKPLVLCILDGYGISSSERGNAIKAASTPNLDRLFSNYPTTVIGASGLDVGLPDGQMGNSEVGHTNMGAGRIVYQELTRITKSIKDKDFFENPELVRSITHAKENNKAVHVMGLLSNGGVHSHIDHCFAVIDLCKKLEIQELFVHCFMDGRDVSPVSGADFITQLENYMQTVGVGKIGTVHGRFYIMDRDNRWDRVETAYKTLVYGEGEIHTSPAQFIKSCYEKELTDEFIPPFLATKDSNIKTGDSVIFFNFRPDRARQITRAICDPDFDGFERTKELKGIKYVCFTQYDLTMPNVSVAYKPQTLTNTLGEYISSLDLKQLRVAETEKYAHVTFFFNGGVEAPNKGEDRILIQSPKVATYDLKPEMSAVEVTDVMVKNILSGKYDFIVVNYANPDMVGHTGIMSAAIKAIETVDECVKRVVDALLEVKGNMFMCADHGNSDQLVDYVTGEAFTAHTTNPVPFVLVNYTDGIGLREGGRLADIAPTILDMMDLPKPTEMTGESLLINK